MLNNYEKLFYQIKTTLLNVPNLRKLAYYNTPNALSQPVPKIEEAEKSFYTRPIIYIYADSPEYGINTFISIGLVEAVVLNGSIDASIKISVACKRDIWDLDNNKIRPLSIISEIISALDGVKFATAGKLNLRIIKEVYFNNETVGYTALFEVEDEKVGVVNEF